MSGFGFELIRGKVGILAIRRHLCSWLNVFAHVLFFLKIVSP